MRPRCRLEDASVPQNSAKANWFLKIAYVWSQFIIVGMLGLRMKGALRVFGFCSGKKNHYEVLESKPTASQEELKSRYYSLVKKYHPDVSQTNQEHIKAINEAYSVLSDEAKRRTYDRELAINTKKIQPPTSGFKNQAQGPEETYRPRRPYYDEQAQMFKQKQRFSSPSSSQMFFQNFVIGLVMTAVLLLILGPPKRDARQSGAAIKQFRKQDFDREFEASLMRPRQQ